MPTPIVIDDPKRIRTSGIPPSAVLRQSHSYSDDIGRTTLCNWADVPVGQLSRSLEITQTLIITFAARYLRFLQPASHQLLHIVWMDDSVDIHFRLTNLLLARFSPVTISATKERATVRFDLKGGPLVHSSCVGDGYMELGCRWVEDKFQIWVGVNRYSPSLFGLPGPVRGWLHKHLLLPVHTSIDSKFIGRWVRWLVGIPRL